MTNSIIKPLILFCIFSLTCNQKYAKWPWSETTVRYTHFPGHCPKDRSPNLAAVVIHDDDVYHLIEWEWHSKDWVRALTRTIGEKIKA